MPQPQYQLTLTHLPPDIPASLLGQTIRLHRLPTTVGRGKDAGVTVKHRSLSRLHCRFYMTNGRLAVKDLASTNGTLINGFRISDDSYLQVGDHITFGSIVFQLSLLNDSVNQRHPEAVPESAQAEASPVTAPSNPAAEAGQPATDQLVPFQPDSDRQPSLHSVSERPAHEAEILPDLVQTISNGDEVRMSHEQLEAFSEDSADELFVDDDKPAIDPDSDLASIIDDSNKEFAQECFFSDSSQMADVQKSGNTASMDPHRDNQQGKGSESNQPVVFFESDPAAAGTSQKVKPFSVDEKDSANEREMSVESAAEKEDVASIMQRHQLGQPKTVQQDSDKAISLDDSPSSSPTPIIQDRPEDRPNSSSSVSSQNVIDFDVPQSGPKVSSVNIETSFVAGSSGIDLGDFMKGSLTGKPTADDLVLDEPAGEGPSMTALGEFFKKKKD